jgi:hypothetical protein
MDVGTVLGLGAVVNFIIQFLRDSFDPSDRIPRGALALFSLLVSFAGTFAFDINTWSDELNQLRDIAGQIVTAFTVAAGSALVHSVRKGLTKGAGANPKGILPAGGDNES